ncbi:mitochondrial fission 1 protein A, partial [Tanacetum coccineum]
MQEIKGMLGSTIKGFDYLPWTDSETILVASSHEASYGTASLLVVLLRNRKMRSVRYPYSWVLVHSRQPDDIYRGVTMLKAEPETKCTLVDSAATPVEFVTGMLSATTSRSSYPTWGIENVPNRMRPVTLKKSIQHTTEIDAIDGCV